MKYSKECFVLFLNISKLVRKAQLPCFFFFFFSLLDRAPLVWLADFSLRRIPQLGACSEGSFAQRFTRLNWAAILYFTPKTCKRVTLLIQSPIFNVEVVRGSTFKGTRREEGVPLLVSYSQIHFIIELFSGVVENITKFDFLILIFFLHSAAHTHF